MIVVDCASVVDALTAIDGTDDLRALLAGEELCAPMLLDFEVVSALRAMTLREELTATRAQDVLTDFEDLPIQRWPSADPLRRRAFELRDSLSAYDAAYIVHAEALDCPLVTRDLRLARTSRQLIAVDVR